MSRKLMNGKEPPEKDTTVEIVVNAGYYNSMEELSDELNYATSRAFSRVDSSIEPPDFYYKPMTRRMFFTIPPGMTLQFAPALESILGLTEAQNPMCNKSSFKTTRKGDLSCDLQTGIHALYYCDILQFTR